MALEGEGTDVWIKVLGWERAAGTQQNKGGTGQCHTSGSLEAV